VRLRSVTVRIPIAIATVFGSVRAIVVDPKQSSSPAEGHVAVTAVTDCDSGLQKMKNSLNQPDSQPSVKTVVSYLDFFVAYSTIPGSCEVVISPKICDE